ncbi:MAG: amidase family protein [Vulcanimicrobiota bacterium]
MKTVRMLVLCCLLISAVGLRLTPQSQRLRPLDFKTFQADLAGFSAARRQTVGQWLRDCNILQLQDRMSRGQLTSEQLTLYCLDQIRQRDERLRGYIELNPRALQEARESDRLRASGTMLGPLQGIPINLKDNIETATPMHTSGGAEILLNYVPLRDAPLVTDLRQSGAVILGKASLSELAGVVSSRHPGFNAVSGAGLNPYGAGLPVLGSSSGSAITTSAYLTVASVGTETSGSLLAPASFNGVVAMKPSLQLVSNQGVIPLIHFQDSPGPVARTVTDAAVLLQCLAHSSSYLDGLKAEALQGVRVGLLPEAWTPGLRAQRIRLGLQQAGAISITLHQPLQGIDLQPNIVLGVSYDLIPYLRQCGAPVRSLAELQRYNLSRSARRIPFGQDFVDLCLSHQHALLQQAGLSQAEGAEYYHKLSLSNRARASQILNQIFERDRLEVLVSHSNVSSAYYATAGFPAITIPLGLNQNGLPISVSLIGKPGQDGLLLSYAYALEQATRLRVDP